MTGDWRDIAGSILGFAGAALLSVDALLAVSRAREKSGAQHTAAAAREAGAKLVDPAENPLSSPDALEKWFAKRSQKLAWLGFLLLAAGFGFDLASKLH